MKIQLNEEFYITTEPNNIVLVDCRTKAELKRYFRTVEEALERFLEEVRRDKTADFNGTITKYYTLIKGVNADAVAKLRKGIAKNDE